MKVENESSKFLEDNLDEHMIVEAGRKKESVGIEDNSYNSNDASWQMTNTRSSQISKSSLKLMVKRGATLQLKGSIMLCW